MRTKQAILADYLRLINKEKGMGYDENKISELLSKEKEFAALEKLMKEELYSVEEHEWTDEKGNRYKITVSTERAFYIYCKCVVHKDLRSGRLIWNSFVKKQFNLVEKNQQTCYMAHRGSGKSFFLALYVSFKMYLLDYFDVCYSTNIPKQKRRWMKTFRSLVDNNEFLKEKKNVRGVVTKETPWGQEEAEYNNGILEATTVGSTPRGGHYNLVIGDDPLREDNKYPMEKIIDYFQGVLKPTTYTKKARYIIVGTPSDNEDLFHTLMNDKLDKNNRPVGKVITEKKSMAGFFSMIFPAILNEKTKEVLLPEIWTYDSLMEERGKIGDIRFAREMLCRCISYKNSLIGASLFRSCCDESMTLIQKGEPEKRYLIVVDSATSDAPTADFCAISVWEDDKEGDRIILRNLFHGKGVPVTDPTGGSDDQTNIVYNFWKRFNQALIIIEKNNAGIALSQSVQAFINNKEGKSPELIEHYTHQVSTGRPTDKPGKANDIINYIEHGIKGGKVVFPANYDDYYTIDALEKVKNEHLNFGVKKGKSGEVYEALAGHDDIFDNCWMAWKFRGDQADTIPFGMTLPGIA